MNMFDRFACSEFELFDPKEILDFKIFCVSEASIYTIMPH